MLFPDRVTKLEKLLAMRHLNQNCNCFKYGMFYHKSNANIPFDQQRNALARAIY